MTRADLGWGPSPAAYANPREGLCIHYDSADQNLAEKAHEACVDYWRGTRGFHTGPSRGWADLGYSFMACPHGHVLEGRGLFKTQAAQPGGNSSYYSCTLATGPTDEITPQQIEAVRQLRAWLMEPETSIAGTVKGHRDFISTSCPGDRAYALVRDGSFRKAPAWNLTDDNPEENDTMRFMWYGRAEGYTLRAGDEQEITWTGRRGGTPEPPYVSVLFQNAVGNIVVRVADHVPGAVRLVARKVNQDTGEVVADLPIGVFDASGQLVIAEQCYDRERMRLVLIADDDTPVRNLKANVVYTPAA
nr:peptidoglycan recognition family protein [Nocardiopsis trehalosi]